MTVIPTWTSGRLRESGTAYWGLFRSSMRANLSHRSDLVLAAFALGFRLFVMVAIWRSVYDTHRPTGVPSAGVTVAYVAISLTLLNVAAPWQFSSIPQRVRTGLVAFDVRRPVGYLGMNVATQLGFAAIAFPRLVIVAGALLVSGTWHRPAAGTMVLGLLSVLLGLLTTVILNFMVSLVSFWTLDNRGAMISYRVFVQFASGAMIPFWFLPAGWVDVLNHLPFTGQVYLPAAILVGEGDRPASGLALQVAWLVILLPAAQALTRVALRRLVIVGG